MTSTPTQVGQPLERLEDDRFLRGEGCYVDDFSLPGMVHAVVVRSTVAHGRLLGIDTAAARSLLGVVAVLTFEDIAEFMQEIPVRVGPLEGLASYQQRPMATGTLRYVGEPVALVIADDRYLAEDAAARVAVHVETLPAVTTMDAAQSDATVVHRATGTNVAARYSVARGDADAAFGRAAYVRKESFHVQRHSAVPIETRGLVAQFDGSTGRLQVWGATKVPFYNRRLLAAMLAMPEADVDLLELDVGGSFGTRGEFYHEDLQIPLAAKLTGRPVKWIEDRRESLVAMNHSRDMACELEIAAQADGKILALRARMRTDIGAYARTTGGIVSAKAASFLPGPYDIAHCAVEVSVLVTNKTPSGTYRGPGRYEANFFRERLIDIMAAELTLDPVAVRRLNLIRPAQMPYPIGALVPYEGAAEYDSGDYPAAFEHALERIDYRRIAASRGQLVDGRRQGIGMACFVDSSGAGPAEYARLRIHSPTRVELFTGVSSSGQGHETSFAQILGDELGLPVDAVKVVHGSTTALPKGFGTYHGRGLVMGGSAVKKVGEASVAKLLLASARRSGRSVADLRYHRGLVLDAANGATVDSLAALCSDADHGDLEARHALEADAEFAQTRLTFEYGTQIAHVAVDVETSSIEVLRLVTVEDCGRVINPAIVHGQVLGASVQGLGGALLEEFSYDEAGRMLGASLLNYVLPSSVDFPEVEAFSVDLAPSTLNPLGAKGVGEGGIEGVGAAVANAVADALRDCGVSIVSLPLSRNNLSRCLREAKERRAATAPGERPA